MMTELFLLIIRSLGNKTPAPKSGRMVTATHKALTGSQPQICCLRPSMDRAVLMARAAEMKSTSSNVERITAGRLFITNRLARVWSRRFWNTLLPARPRVECSIAARRFRNFGATFSLVVCEENGLFAWCWLEDEL